MAVQINVQANQTALAKSIAQGVAQFNARLASQNQLNLQINARSFTQPLGRITSDLGDFESAIKASNARVLAFGASAAVIGGVAKAFRDVATSTIDVEKNLIEINRVLGLSNAGLKKFSSELFSITKQTAVSFQEAATAATEFSRQGLGVEETLKRTRDALILVRLAGVDSAKAVSDLTAAVNGFTREGLDTSQVLNRVVAVEQAFAVSAKDLTEALSRAGQAALEAKGNFNQLNALVAAAQETTARGGAVIGNALKTIFTRIQRSETITQLERFNVEVRDIQGNILPAVQILKNFAGSYKTLSDSQKAYLSQQIAGVYQINILKALVNDLNSEQSIYNKALAIGATATNNAYVANEQLNKSLSALISQTTTGLQQLSSNIGKVTFKPIFEAIVSPINDAVAYMNEVLEGEGIGSDLGNGLLKGLRNVLAGPVLVSVLAVIAKIAKNTFTDLTKAVPALLGLTSASQRRADIEQSVLNILKTQGDAAKALLGYGNDRKSQADLLLRYARQTTAEYRAQQALARSLSETLVARNVSVGSRGLQTGRRFAGGYIPESTKQAEIAGAISGGYKPGSVMNSPIGGVMNAAEQVKYVAGFNQPFINPPASSKAGRNHRRNSMIKTGIDPYASLGFIPNFAPRKLFGETDEEYARRRAIPTEKNKSSKNIKRVKSFDASNVGILALSADAGSRSTTNSGQASVKSQDLSADIRNSPSYKKKIGADYTGPVVLNNIQLRTLDTITNLSGRVGQADFSNFTQRIDKELLDATASIVSKSPLSKIFKNPLVKASTIKQQLSNNPEWKNLFPEATQGNMFEYAIRLGTKSAADFTRASLGDKQAPFDFEETGSASPQFKKIFGFTADRIDAKRTATKDAVDSLVRKSFNSGIFDSFKPLSALGFIPNFAYKNAVMSLEQNASGKKAIFSNNPFPHVRNSSQPSFQAAISDHGGLNKALKDSYASQINAGLMSSGFIPNFAKLDPLISSQQAFGKETSELSRKNKKLLVRLNNALARLTSGVELSSQQMQKLNGDAVKFSNQIKAATGSTIAVEETQKILKQATSNLAKASNSTANTTTGANTTAGASTTGRGGRAGYTSLSDRMFGGIDRAGKALGYNPRLRAKGRLARMKGGGGVGLGLGLSIGAPILAGVAEQFISGGKERYEQSYGQRALGGGLSAATSGASTGALIGSAIPGIGTAAGAVIGGLLGLTKAAFSAAETLDDIANKREALFQRIQAEEDAVDNIIELTKKIQSGDVSDAEKKNLLEQRGIAYAKLSDDAKQILPEKDLNDLQKVEKNRYALQKANTQEKYKAEIEDLKFSKKLSAENKRNALLKLYLLGKEDKDLGSVLNKLTSATNVDEVRDVFFKSEEFKNLDQPIADIIKESLSNSFSGVSSQFSQPVEFINPLLYNLKTIAADFEAAASDPAVEGSVGKITRSATQIFDDLEVALSETSRQFKLQLAKDSGSLALRKSADQFALALQEGILSPIEIIKKSTENQRSYIEKEFKNSQIEAANAFNQSFANAARSSEGVSASLAGELETLLKDPTKTIDDLITTLEGVKAIGEGTELTRPEQLKKLKELAQDRKLAEQEAKINNDSQLSLLDQEANQQQIRASLIEAEKANLLTLSSLQDQRARQLASSQVDTEIVQARREAALQDPTRFFGQTFRSETEQRIAARRQTIQENNVLFTRGQLQGARASSENLSASLKTDLSSLDPFENMDLYVGLAKANEELAKFNITSEEGLKKAIKSQELILQNIKDSGGSNQLQEKIQNNLKTLKDAEQSITDEIRKQNELLKIQEEQERKLADLRGTAAFGYGSAVDQIKREAEMFPETFARDTTFAFRDGLVSAMDAAANSTGNLKEALLGVVNDFARSIQKAMFTNIANQIVGSFPMPSFGGNQRGGIIRAQNGMYISGGRTGDRNVALLEDGEYVLNREAVKGLGGPRALDALNYNKFPRFASGGRLKSGERKLSPNIDFNAVMSSSGADAYSMINEGAESGRLSAFALENTAFIQEYAQQKKQIDAEKRRKREAKRAQRRQLIVSAITSAVGLGISGFMSGAFSAKPTIDASTGYTQANISAAKDLGFTNKALAQFQDAGVTLNSSGIPNYQTGGRVGFNSGGYVPYGNRITDSVPAMLTGGEYVVNSRAVRKYGVGGLNSVNSGTANLQEGGYSASNLTNNLSFNINIDNKGSAGVSVKEEREENMKTEKNRYNEFSQKVKESVLQVIQQEQRSGGLLDNTKKRTQ